MKLTVLGSGSSIPHPRRASPGFWLDIGSHKILLDIGPDVPHRMAEDRLDWPELDAIWVSHFHLDHFGGLPSFLFSLRWAPQTANRTKTLRIIGPHGLNNLLKTIDDANNYRLFTQRFPVEVIEIKPDEQFEFMPGVMAQTMRTPHTSESLALNLRDPDAKRFVYTSDTGFTKELSKFAEKADMLLMECSFRGNKPLQTHLELAEAMSLARECRPARLVLTHLYPEWDEFDVVTESSKLWQGEVIEAKDGLIVMI
jgi:ribonuclease BN (tRNA processing enzyme)